MKNPGDYSCQPSDPLTNINWATSQTPGMWMLSNGKIMFWCPIYWFKTKVFFWTQGQLKGRLQALTIEREVSYDDDFGFGESDDEVGDEEEGGKGENSSPLVILISLLQNSLYLSRVQAFIFWCCF